MNRTWAIVQAGGDGTRLEAESVKRYGYPRPKQYCDFDGAGTLLDRTLERARTVVPEDRIVVVTTRRHRAEADDVLSRWPAVRRIEQPRNADTTAGMLLPTLHVLAHDAQATLLFLPSDHHVRDERAFTAALARSAAIPSASGGIVILGAEPEGPEDGYGWVVPGAVDGAGAHSVERFREKPPLAEVETLVESGALVNTFVLAARVETMVALVARHVPETWERLSTAWWSDDRLTRAYAHLPPSNFSRDVLEHAPALRVVRVAAGWSDVGTPDRLERDLLASPPARSVSVSPLRGEAHV
jgi:mannose-1-phosphate guanylyltransferase